MTVENEEKDTIDIPAVEVNSGDTPPEGYTQDEWDNLSEAEREGLRYDDNVGTTEEAEEPETTELSEEELAKIAEEGEAEGETKTDAAETEAGPGETKPAEGETKPDGSVRLTDEDLLSYRPSIDETKLPTAGEEIVSPELQTKLDEIKEKYDSGDMPLADWIAERDKINRQIIRENTIKSQSERDEAIEQQRWESIQAKFFEARPEYGDTSRGKMLYGALNQAVKELSTQPENSGISGMVLLVKADKLIRKEFGIGEVIKPEPAKPITKKPAAPIPDIATLSDAPNAAPAEVAGWITAIDNLKGEAYENALAKLTPEQKKRYEKGR